MVYILYHKLLCHQFHKIHDKTSSTSIICILLSSTLGLKAHFMPAIVNITKESGCL